MVHRANRGFGPSHEYKGERATFTCHFAFSSHFDPPRIKRDPLLDTCIISRIIYVNIVPSPTATLNRLKTRMASIIPENDEEAPLVIWFSGGIMACLAVAFPLFGDNHAGNYLFVTPSFPSPSQRGKTDIHAIVD